jgi:hypothetical protein
MEGHSTQNPSMSVIGIYRQPLPVRLQFTATPVQSDHIMKIPAGTTGYIGAPAQPIRKEISDAIGSELGQIPEILEVHLPQVYIKGLIDPPAQILFVVVEENTPSLQGKIAEVMKRVLPPNFYMDITELHPSNPQLPAIRASGSQLNLNRKLN